MTLFKDEISALPPLYYAQRHPPGHRRVLVGVPAEGRRFMLWSLVFLGRERIPVDCQLVGEPGDVWLTETTVQMRTLAGWTDWEPRRTPRGGFSHPYLPSDYKLSFLPSGKAFAYMRTRNDQWRAKWAALTPNRLRAHLYEIMGEDEESLRAATRAVNATTKPSGELMGYYEVPVKGVAAVVYAILARRTPMYSSPPQHTSVHISRSPTPTPALEEPVSPPEPRRHTRPLDLSTTAYANRSQYSVPYTIPVAGMYACYDPRCLDHHGHAACPSHAQSSQAERDQQLTGHPGTPEPAQSWATDTPPYTQTCPPPTSVWTQPPQPFAPQSSVSSWPSISTLTQSMQPMQPLTPQPSASSWESTDSLMYPPTPPPGPQEILHEVEPSPRPPTPDVPALDAPTPNALTSGAPTPEPSRAVHAAAPEPPFTLVNQLLGVIGNLQSRVAELEQRLAEQPPPARDGSSLPVAAPPAAVRPAAAPAAEEPPAAPPAVVCRYAPTPFVDHTQVVERDEFTDASSSPEPESPIAHDVDSDASEYDGSEEESDEEMLPITDGSPPNNLPAAQALEREAVAGALPPVEPVPAACAIDDSPSSVLERARLPSAPRTQPGFWTWMTQYWQS
ncbi:hypothetical protein PsYK624_073170 [Phanerochaete sordida]|uniref:Uncharacterized protein n=1 Tax=Phanerochaete sordida TaxID=48140 RepID=A0A9P3LE63_9APHY|nr:hypothetical protein PsYK624_073170 [Phanerochaete sordida]